MMTFVDGCTNIVTRRYHERTGEPLGNWTEESELGGVRFSTVDIAATAEDLDDANVRLFLRQIRACCLGVMRMTLG